MPQYNYKFVMVGESSVGKTCMLLRYAENSFTDTFLTTVGVDFKAVKLIVDDNPVQLQVWDTAGQEQFRTITKSYFRGAHGIVLTFDVTSRVSFNRTQLWMDSIAEAASENADIILVGNKRDCEIREVTPEDAAELAEQYGVPYIEASAKTGENISLIFETLTRIVMRRKIAEPPQTLRRVDVLPAEPTPDPDGLCC
jgi:small GTP-binding protein